MVKFPCCLMFLPLLCAWSSADAQDATLEEEELNRQVAEMEKELSLIHI